MILSADDLQSLRPPRARMRFGLRRISNRDKLHVLAQGRKIKQTGIDIFDLRAGFQDAMQ